MKCDINCEFKYMHLRVDYKAIVRALLLSDGNLPFSNPLVGPFFVKEGYLLHI